MLLCIQQANIYHTQGCCQTKLNSLTAPLEQRQHFKALRAISLNQWQQIAMA